LRVHPGAVPQAEAALEHFDERTGLGKLARVVADPALPEHGCVLESELGRIDASLGTQIEAIREAINNAVRPITAADSVFGPPL
jgi:flagellar biosynthesis/type III secretory pathway protein FliH